ncbi:MAG: TIGR03364 family FAD-dependent oxidoreductase [Pirellulales bacterium]
MSSTFDDAVVGAGILGLAHAFHLARRGRRVIVFERNARAAGASVRNFGMLWPIGQPAGPMHEMALSSRAFWLEVLRASGLWHETSGSLHLAYRQDEAQVLAEFTAGAAANGYECELLAPEQVARRSPAVKTTGLAAGMWSPTEICVDPREVIAGLPGWLTRTFGVRFEFGSAVTAYDRPRVSAGDKTYRAERLVVCSGDDFQTLYPGSFAGAGLVRSKLQMMRSQAYGARLGPMLAGGLTLRHYKNFENCPSLEAVKSRVARDHPEYDRYGIHVMASQNAHGELVIGDSHEYDGAIEPFDKPEIDRLILDYLHTFLAVPELEITARWHGTYAKHPREPYLIARPAPGATVVTATGGAGMTLSFGLADHVVRNLER